jgi:small conductance mechanosensitive channel
MDWSKIQETVIGFLITYGFQLFGAFVILTLGALGARWVGNFTGRSLEKYKLDLPVRMLIVRVVKLLVFALAAILALDKFGVQIAPLIAGLGVAGVGVGLAMQGMLSNIVAGLTIIFTKPFRVGEYIELLGVSGQVTNIELFSTKLIHTDRSVVTVPNRKIIGEILHNFGTIRQLSLNVGVAYASDLTRVLRLIDEILRHNARVLKDPSPVVGITSLADSAVIISVQPWVKVPDYGPAQLEIHQAIVEHFRAASIEIPFPQREVRMLGTPTV